ncbi:Tn3 family transposase [Escherichia coli]
MRAHWDDILRLASSIKQGTVTASLMLRKLGSYPRQNGLAVALREARPDRAHAVHPGLAAKC